MWLSIIIGVAVFIVLAVALKAVFSNGPAIDRLRRSDPDAAARLDMDRAEHGTRGAGNPLGGGF